jgi:hypothetical protein
MKYRKPARYATGVVLGAGLLLLFLAISGCTTPDEQNADGAEGWESTLLTDVRSGTQFSISDLRGTPVLIQAFTITCPICMQQQAEISKLNASGTVPFVMVGLDIDPNGDAGSLRDYTRSSGYYGLYARSPPDMTRALVDQFGMLVLSPAQAPLIVVCPDGTASILGPGVKSAEDLQKVLVEGCRA